MTAVAGGTWGIADMQLSHERDQYAECTGQLDEANEFIASLSTVCDDRIEGRISGVSERLDECIGKLLMWNERASSGALSGGSGGE